MSLTTFQKVIFMGAVPLLAAGIGASATYLSNQSGHEQIVITGDAAKAAKDGKLTIEIVRREEGNDDNSWKMIFAGPLMFLGMAALLWAGNKSQ